jgi:hypothetical protein
MAIPASAASAHAGLALALVTALLGWLPARGADGPSPAALVRWSFAQDTQGWTAAHDCSLAVQDGVLVVTNAGPDPYLHSPTLTCQGPLLLRFRSRCSGSGQGRVYWTVLLPSLVASTWSEDAAAYVDLPHDGQWHETTVPIPAEGQLAQVRLDPCRTAARVEIEWIELAPPAADDALAAVRNPALPDHVTIRRGPLRVELDTASHRFTVHDRRSDRGWLSAPPTGVRLLDAGSQGGDTMSLRLAAGGQLFTCRVVARPDAAVQFELDADTPDAAFTGLPYPPRLESALTEGAVVFCNRSCGQLVDQKDLAYPQRQFACYGNLGLDLPWVGVTDRHRGDGVMVLLETPVDATVALLPDAEGRLWPQPRWTAAGGHWSYARRASWRFAPEGGYVALAKIYRRYAQQTGPWKTLTEKARERPAVSRLKGAADTWGVSSGTGGPTALPFALEARAAGITRAIINGNGKFPAEDMARINAMGFLTGEYDNYDDIREGPLAMQSDSVEQVALRGSDGKPATGWVTLEGVRYSRRASSHALAAARQLIPPILATYPFNARFLDVTPTVDLVEDYNPACPADRRQDLASRRELLGYVASLGLVLGGEHGKAWNADLLDYAEGTMSGPFWWEMPAGHLVVPTSRDEIKANYLQYGINPAARIPLWELVFHDCVVTTWYWGDSSGYTIDVAPELSDVKDLANLLYGTVPLLWVDHRGYGWNRHRQRFLETYRNTCKLHEVIGFAEMLSHEFLSADRLLQRTRFAGGAAVVVNFGAEPRPYRDGLRRRVTLAPQGFLVRAGPLQQSRLLEDGQIVTRIQAPGFRVLECPVPRQEDGLAVNGRLAVYELAPDQWGCTLESAAPASVDLGRLAGRRQAAHCRIFTVGENGQRDRELTGAADNGVLTLPGGPGLQVFALDLAAPRRATRQP